VAGNARRHLARAGGQAGGKLARLVEELETTIARTGQLIGQTRIRLAGQTPDGATRLVSLHDANARPICKGRLGKPVEFGYKAQVADNPDGVVLDYQVELGNPPDAPLLVPAVQRISQRAGRTPKAVDADRQYGEAAIDVSLPPWAWSEWRSLARANQALPAEPTSTPAVPAAGQAATGSVSPLPPRARPTSRSRPTPGPPTATLS
jgi:hypothetical protein